MRILNRYILFDFMVTFAMTLVIFTFVMCLGAVVKAIDLLARGVSGWFMLQVFSLNIPFILTFSIPMSVLTAVLLQFGRMSYDGEVTAMRASGLSMWQIVSPVIFMAILLSGFCVYLSGTVAPRSHFAQRQVLARVGMETPIGLLEEGRFVRDFPGFMVYVGKKDTRQVTDVVVYEMDGDSVVRNIRAKSGEIRADEERKLLLIDLYDVRIDQPDKEHPMDPSRSRYINAQHYPVELDFADIQKKGELRKKTSDMTYAELLIAIHNVRSVFPHLRSEDVIKQRMALVVEANKRLALSLSCFAFSLLGIPLGLKSRRKESSVGVGISLLLVFGFYFFIILADALTGSPEWRPDLIVWIPVLGAEMVGFALIRRSNQTH